MSQFHLQYQQYLTTFEEYAKNYFENLHTHPELLGKSMEYSFLNGGKRIRPILALACADVLNVDKTEVLPFALALEMIHTYSLIHDDLPAMDNDDFRRGKPTNHKEFGEGNAILAGDGLLNEAYAICFDECIKGEKYALAAKYLNECAGIFGMIAGQSADLYFSNQETVTEKDLFYVYEHKTGKLLLAPVAIASILSGNRFYFVLEEFGKLLGRLFQMTDDILDVTGNFDSLGKSVQKDEGKNKLTCIRLYGVEGAKIRADECAEDCLTLLEGIEGDTRFLKEFVEYVRNRNH
ncbi:MAG: polyprenyl synthetase family protein [Clostridia bacterium]|nr:polyprenyl synthetase family protein [Clostridia bacterium]